MEVPDVDENGNPIPRADAPQANAMSEDAVNNDDNDKAEPRVNGLDDDENNNNNNNNNNKNKNNDTNNDRSPKNANATVAVDESKSDTKSLPQATAADELD